MAVLRLKYRPAPIQPELNVPLDDNPFAGNKKIKVVEEENPYTKGDREEVTMFPGYTQKFKVSTIVESDEVALRKKEAPTIYERIAIQKTWVKLHAKEMKYVTEREALQRKWEIAIQKAMQGSNE